MSYSVNGAVQTGYAYDTTAEWIIGTQQSRPLGINMSPQMGVPYDVMFDPSQQQPTYAHLNQYETQTHSSQQFQPQQPSQSGVNTIHQFNYYG